jgi:hypothetical protein
VFVAIGLIEIVLAITVLLRVRRHRLRADTAAA